MNRAEGLRAVIYTRQSRDIEGTGLAVARQLADCERLAAARGWHVTARESDNDISASNGKARPGFERVMAMADAGQADVVIVWAVDRLVRRLADLEAVIERCERAGVKLATVSGDLDLSTDQGRLVARILASVARGEVERKSARTVAANEQMARAGKRRTGMPRPFGFADDRVTHRPAEAQAIRWAADALLGGSTVSAVMREWQARGLQPPQGTKWSRHSVSKIMRNPALAGLRTYVPNTERERARREGRTIRLEDHIVGDGNWAPVLSRETWQAVAALLADPARIAPRGVRTLLGGLARCRCGAVMQGNTNATGRKVYRCSPEHRAGRAGPHAQQIAEPVDAYVETVIIARLSRPDLADLTAPPRPDVAPLHTEAAAIRRNLDELAADRVAGLISRSQMLAATERGTARLREIGAQLAAAASTSALAPFAAAVEAQAVWDDLDGARKRAVIDALAEVVILPAGRGARIFRPETIDVNWRS